MHVNECIAICKAVTFDSLDQLMYFAIDFIQLLALE